MTKLLVIPFYRARYTVFQPERKGQGTLSWQEFCVTCYTELRSYISWMCRQCHISSVSTVRRMDWARVHVGYMLVCNDTASTNVCHSNRTGFPDSTVQKSEVCNSRLHTYCPKQPSFT